MSDTFSGTIRWFACFAMILCCVLAAATGCTKPAYAGCGGSLGLNAGHCNQQFHQQLNAYHLQQQLSDQYALQQALKQQALKQQLRQAQLDAQHAAALALKAQQVNHHHQQQGFVQRLTGGGNRNFTKTVTKTRNR